MFAKLLSSLFEALAKLFCPACATGLGAEGRQRVWSQLSDALGDLFSPVKESWCLVGVRPFLPSAGISPA